MKKVLLSFALIYTISAFNAAEAQLAVNYKSQPSTSPYDSDLSNTNENLDANSINLIALKDFKKRVTSTVNENWETTADGFVAYYSKDAVINKLIYDKKGKWKFTVLDYTRNKLEPVLRDAVEYAYEGTVYNVNEIHTAYKIVYIVRVADATTYKTIRIADGEMEMIETLKK
jgi:hypothetical protein